MLQFVKASHIPSMHINNTMHVPSNDCIYPLLTAESLYQKLLNNKAYFTALGGFCINFIVGGYLAVGEFIPYMASYVTASAFKDDVVLCTKDVQYSYSSNTALCNWLLTAWTLGYALFGCVGGMIRLHMQWSTRSILILGGSIITLQFLITYRFSHNPYVMLCSFGGIFGIGCGILFSPTIVCVLLWFPKNKALLTGILLSALTVGSICFSLVATLYINPNNIPNDELCGYSLYPHIISAVPGSFLLLAFFSMICTLIGALFLFDKSYDYNTKYSVDTYTDDDIEWTHTQYKQQYTLKEALSSLQFWLIFGNVGCNIYVISFTYSDWKLFAENYILIENDALLLVLNVVAAICSGVGRIVWGMIYDYFKSYKGVMFTVTFSTFILIVTMPFCKGLNPIVTFVCLCVLWFFNSATYVIVPPAICNAFGDKYCAILTGFIMMSEIGATVLQSGFFFFLTKLDITTSNRWIVLFGINALFMVLSCCISLQFSRPKHLKDLSADDIKVVFHK